MKYAKIIHNPGAGNGEPNQKKLISLVESSGYKCNYSSVKKEGWEKLKFKKEDFILVAGGDGTVRKVARQLLGLKLLEKPLPIALLPLGTANNIANSLKISEEQEAAIKTWKFENITSFDVAKVHGLEEPTFFLEGMGFGIFPELIRKMKKSKKMEEPPKLKLARSLELLLEIILSYKPKPCQLKMDGMECSGKFLLAEVMNTPSIGPNLKLAPSANPGDGELEVVLIPEGQREEFAAYVRNKIAGREAPPFFTTIKARKLEIRWEDSYLHVDDDFFELNEPVTLKVEILQGVLEFLAGNGEFPQKTSFSE